MFGPKIRIAIVCVLANTGVLKAELWPISAPEGVGNVVELTNALANVKHGDEIVLAPGVYNLSNIVSEANCHLVFRKNPQSLDPHSFSYVIRGEETDFTKTVLLGGGAEKGCRIVKHYLSQVTVSNLTFSGGYISDSGGCIVNDGTGGAKENLFCVNCLFTNNQATANGGAIYNYASTFRDCHFVNNVSGKSGGGAFTLNVSNCTFRGNRAQQYGGGMHGGSITGGRFEGNVAHSGGGAYNSRPAGTRFIGNTASNGGGGALWMSSREYGATNCYFQSNMSVGSGSAVYGGCLHKCEVVGHTGTVYVLKGVFVTQSVLTNNTSSQTAQVGIFGDGSEIWNSLIAYNFRTVLTNGMIVSSPVYNCTIVSNQMEAFLDGKSRSPVGAVAVNCIIAGNKPYDLIEKACGVMTNCLYGTRSGKKDVPAHVVGCIEGCAPRFVDAAKGDFRLTTRSPARNAGWYSNDYLDSLGEFDLNGDARIFTRDGVGRLDLGCYECQLILPGLRIMLQ